MDQTKPSSYIKSILNESMPIIDFATFLGTGILASSYLTTWINDPVSKGGIVFASLLNATLLGVGNKEAKIDEKTSFSYKAVVTIATLALGGFAAPYLIYPSCY